MLIINYITKRDLKRDLHKPTSIYEYFIYKQQQCIAKPKEQSIVINVATKLLASQWKLKRQQLHYYEWWRQSIEKLIGSSLTATVEPYYDVSLNDSRSFHAREYAYQQLAIVVDYEWVPFEQLVDRCKI